MSLEITATATLQFSPTPSVQALNATSTISETPEDKQFVRIIGGADTEDNQLPLSANVYPALGGGPVGWLWVKNIDPSGTISVRIRNLAQITTEALEFSRLGPGQAIIVKIGRDTDGSGDLLAETTTDIVICGSGATLYDMVVTAGTTPF